MHLYAHNFKALLSQIHDGKYWWLLNWIALVVILKMSIRPSKHSLNARLEVIILQLGKLDGFTIPKLMLQMLAAVAEMERDLLVERTQSGLASQKRKVLGRPVKTTMSTG